MPIFAHTSLQDTTLIEQIAARILADPAQSPYNHKMSAMISLILTHCNGTPLALEALLAADHESFWHDIKGIAHHLDHRTGRLAAGFRPLHCLQ